MSVAAQLNQDNAPPETAGEIPGIAWVNGEFQPLSEAKLSLLDWGFVRGDCTYDVVSVFKGAFFRLDDHVDRFLSSMAKLRLTMPFDRDGLIEVMTECARRPGLRDAFVKIVCTRGLQPPSFSRNPRDALNQLFVYSVPYTFFMTEEQRARGMHLHVASTPRIPTECIDPTIKNYNRLDFVSGIFEAYDAGADQVVMPDMHGNITEGLGFNVFVIRDGRATSPGTGVLEGVTRKVVLELCEDIGLPARLGTVSVEDLLSADEAFLCTTAGGVVGITEVNGRTIANGMPRETTRRLDDLYWAKHEDPAYITPIDYGA